MKSLQSPQLHVGGEPDVVSLSRSPTRAGVYVNLGFTMVHTT